MDGQPDAPAGWWRVSNAIIDQYAAQIGPNALSVYCYLARCADSQHQCWPSHALIAAKIGIGEATVQRAVKRLVTVGLLRVEGRANGMGFQISNRYTLLKVPGATAVSAPSPQSDVTLPQSDVTPPQSDVTLPQSEVGRPLSLMSPSPQSDVTVPSERGRGDLTVMDEQDPLEPDPSEPNPPEQNPPHPHPPSGWVPYGVGVKMNLEHPTQPPATGGTRWRERLAREGGIQNQSVLNEVACTALWLENKGRLADVEAVLEQARWHKLGGGWVAQELRRLGRESVTPPRDAKGRRLPPVLPAATPVDEFEDIKRRYGGYLAYTPAQEETSHA